MSGSVVSIHIAPEASGGMKRIDEAHAVPGKGLEGDRYFGGGGTWSETPGTGRQVTLIEAEAIEAMARDNDVVIDPGEARRNIVTRGVALNHLVDKEFKVGEALLKGTRLSEPCAHLEKLSKPGVVKGLIHRGGLRADILEGGVIRPGDPVAPE